MCISRAPCWSARISTIWLHLSVLSTVNLWGSALKTHRLKGTSLMEPVYDIGQLPHSQIPSSGCPPLCTSQPIFVDSWVCQGGYEAHEAPWAGHPCWMYSLYSAYWHRVWSLSSLLQVIDAVPEAIIMEPHLLYTITATIWVWIKLSQSWGILFIYSQQPVERYIMPCLN